MRTIVVEINAPERSDERERGAATGAGRAKLGLEEQEHEFRISDPDL